MDSPVDDDGLPVIGYLLRRKAEAAEVADYLEKVAHHVREGNLIGFELKWNAGGEQIESKVLPRTPADFIKLNFVVEDENDTTS